MSGYDSCVKHYNKLAEHNSELNLEIHNLEKELTKMRADLEIAKALLNSTKHKVGGWLGDELTRKYMQFFNKGSVG